MEHKFYIGDGEEAKAIISETQNAIQKFNSECVSLAEEYGAEGVALMNGKPTGLVFKDKPDLPYLKVSTQRDGECFCYPLLNFKTGKELSSKLNAIQKVTASEHIIEVLGVGRWIAGKHLGSQTGMAMYHSVAGYGSGVLVVKIPTGEGGDEMPTVPEWLREVKESEFLAAQGK